MYKTLIWDLETSSLSADSGIILCMGFKYLGEKETYCYTIRDYKYEPDPWLGDKKLLSAIHKVLSDASIWVTYNGTMFDTKFFQTRALIAGLEPLPPVSHVDLYFAVKAKLRLHRSSLAALQTALDLNEHKTPIEFSNWMRAVCAKGKIGDTAMEKIVAHCKADVRVLEEAYIRMRPLLMRHPNDGIQNKCHVCQSTHMQLRGYALVRTPLRNVKRRLQCRECFHWQTRALTPDEKTQYYLTV